VTLTQKKKWYTKNKTLL